MHNIHKLIILTISSLFFVACSGIRTSALDSAAVVKTIRRDLLTTGTLSPDTQQIIRMAGLTEKAVVGDGGEFLLGDRSKYIEIPLKLTFASAEIAMKKALSLEKSDPSQARAYFLRSGRQALKGMFDPACKDNVNLICDHFKVYYLRSTLALLQALQEKNWDGTTLGTMKVGEKENYTLSVRHDHEYEAPQNYETITASALIAAEGLTNRHIRYGIGLPLTACRDRNMELPSDQYLPRVGTCLPLTAVLDFDDTGNDNSHASIEFHNAFNSKTIRVQGHEFPLAANFTAPFASIVEKTGMGNFDGLFNAFSDGDELLQDTGFYSVEPYNADKIPLITVHGLFSSPLTWLDLHNDMMGDPVIREHFQIWHYLYPTNLPILENAVTYRKNLDQLQQHIQTLTKGKEELSGMVVIAHSMGGLLTRTAVAKEDPSFESQLFSSPEKIKELDAESQKELNDILGFKRKPYLDRVIFVAVPHRGSPVSDSFVGWIGKSLISLPGKVLQKVDKVRLSIRDYVKPELRSSLDGQDASSVSGLSSSSPAIQILAKVAVDSDVPFHSIIGNRGLPGPLQESSDGVVPYNSSHLEGAQSELIVPAEHSAHTNPLAIKEIKRILYLHLQELLKKTK
jgi:hypothetical protein